jgi:hypothetical protein
MWQACKILRRQLLASRFIAIDEPVYPMLYLQPR